MTDFGGDHTFRGATDKELRKLYAAVLKQWEYYMTNSFSSLVPPLEQNLKALSKEIERRKNIKNSVQVMSEEITPGVFVPQGGVWYHPRTGQRFENGKPTGPAREVGF